MTPQKPNNLVPKKTPTKKKIPSKSKTHVQRSPEKDKEATTTVRTKVVSEVPKPTKAKPREEAGNKKEERKKKF